jgi:hypothetical protein
MIHTCCVLFTSSIMNYWATSYTIILFHRKHTYSNDNYHNRDSFLVDRSNYDIQKTLSQIELCIPYKLSTADAVSYRSDDFQGFLSSPNIHHTRLLIYYLTRIIIAPAQSR